MSDALKITPAISPVRLLSIYGNPARPKSNTTASLRTDNTPW